eukprot:TRINITY_DN102_c0_g1_i1.p1 TRINITY_DN102_c0_g1~~TRINITY_DN102_c0_g1_i1.p1  ORF type:complete len:608 (-),score=168.84 TRINITY_DN102_c0_g1_i1:19-1842(-)
MGFASSHAYVSKRKIDALMGIGDPNNLAAINEEEQNDSCASISDEELDNFNSDNEEQKAPVDPNNPIKKPGRRRKTGKEGEEHKKHKREIDTNVVGLNFSVLKDKTAVATGDPVFCAECKAMLNAHSKLTKNEAGKQIWNCEFCLNANEVQMEEEELPKEDQLMYVLEPAPKVKNDKNEDITVMFCIDTSGSMCHSQTVAGKFATKYGKNKEMESLKKLGYGSQYTSGEIAGMCYISRMQCVLTVIENQLRQLAIGAPKRKVGIVTFNNEVTLIGDGRSAPKTYAGDRLNDYEGLLKASQEDAATHMTKSVEDTEVDLVKRLEHIQESGMTALGPGLTVALGAAIKGTPGSKVIICTDGLANVGIGSLEHAKDKTAVKKTRDFYTQIGALAKSKGVSISVVSIVASDCRLEMLSPLAGLTGGDIVKVDPLDLGTDFANILAENVVASNVELRVNLHKTFTFRNEDSSLISKNGSVLVKPIGNAIDGQEVSAEYRLKPEDELVKLADIDFATVTEIPFQVQITYCSLDGAKCVRTLTKKQNITFEKDLAKKAANFQVLSVHAIQQAASLAQKGDYRGAQANSAHWKKLIKGSEAVSYTHLTLPTIYPV